MIGFTARGLTYPLEIVDGNPTGERVHPTECGIGVAVVEVEENSVFEGEGKPSPLPPSLGRVW